MSLVRDVGLTFTPTSLEITSVQQAASDPRTFLRCQIDKKLKMPLRIILRQITTYHSLFLKSQIKKVLKVLYWPA